MSEKDYSDLLDTARRNADKSYLYWQVNYEIAKDDIKFLNGDQWDQAVLKERIKQGRPCLTLNKLPTYVDQIIGDQRQKKTSIKMLPTQANIVDSKAQNYAGTKDYTLSDVFEGLIKNIEYTSQAETHYDMAFQHAVESGIGWLRVKTVYASDSVFEQDIKISHIRDRFSVLIDPNAKEPDLSDAEYCIIYDRIPKKEFDEKYPNATQGDIGYDTDNTKFIWYAEDLVTICEYFYKEYEKDTVMLFNDGRTMYLSECKDVLDDLEQQDVYLIRTRDIKKPVVYRALITSQSILEEPKVWAGRTIPVVAVFGKELRIDGMTHYRGLIRYAKDPQRMHNYWMSSATEKVALAPKTPFIADAESIEGFEYEWQTANSSNSPVLRYKHIPDVPPPSRTPPTNMPQAEMALALSGTDEIKAVTGIYDASLGNQSNETSGRAILARQQQGDRGSFTYVDNLNKAIASVGRILVDVIPKIYDTERVVRIKFPDDTEDFVMINQATIDQETGKEVLLNDLSVGKFDVQVKSGASYQTQRIENAEAMLELLKVDPSLAPVLLDLLVENLDFNNADQITKRLRKMNPDLLSADEMEKAEIEPPQPDPLQELALQKLQAEIELINAKKLQAEASAIWDNVNAQAIGNQNGIDVDAVAEQAVQQQDPMQMQAMIKQQVADAMAEFMMAQQQQSQQQPQGVLQ